MISDYYGINIISFPIGLIISLFIVCGIIQTSNSILILKKIKITKIVNILFPFFIFSLFVSIINVFVYINLFLAKLIIFIFLFFFFYQSLKLLKDVEFKKNI